MIRTLFAVAAVALLATPATAQDDVRNSVEPALQECIEAVNDSRAGDDGSGDVPSFVECIGAGSDACQQQPGGDSTKGMTNCTAAETAFWDDMLNYSYGQLKDSLAPDIFTALKAAQAAWIPWRDARCNFVYENSKDGTISQVLVSSCLMDTTARRAIELMDLLDGQGDG